MYFFFVYGSIFGVLGIEEPQKYIPNLVVKLYYGENTIGQVL